MCPLRIILIFLSATLAGFFVLRNLNNSSPELQFDADADAVSEDTESPNAVPFSSKVCTSFRRGFWTFVDMASGRYLWRNLPSLSTSKEN